tara:strand:- start:40 stop:729 length:690 start_codon:yes stop_codon:yes gene_type:complete
MSLDALKYIRYAIGEVILVVIGILIALQVNNLNEERKFKIEQKTFLDGLKNELELDTINFRVRIDMYEKRIALIQEARILMFKKKLDDTQKKVFRDAVLKMYRLTPINKNINRHDNKISDGIIQNDELKNIILDYLSKSKFYQDLQSALNNKLKDIYTSKVSNYIGLNFDDEDIPFTYDLASLNNNIDIQNVFFFSLLFHNTALNNYYKQLELASQLIEEIEKELTKSD